MFNGIMICNNSLSGYSNTNTGHRNPSPTLLKEPEPLPGSLLHFQLTWAHDTPAGDKHDAGTSNDQVTQLKQ